MGGAVVEGAETVQFDRSFATSPTLLAGAQVDSGEPVFPTVEGTDTDGAAVTIRNGDGETVPHILGYVALDGTGPLQASESSTVDTTAVEGLPTDEWAQAGFGTDNGFLPLPEEPPEDIDEPPAMAGMEPAFIGHDSVTENLLDMFEEFVVFGHTHAPDLGERHVNTGAWTSRGSPQPANTDAEIDGGDVTVWDWSPEGREKLFD